MAGGRFNLGAQIKGTIPTYDGAAFVGSWDGRFYRLDLADGSEEWSFDTGDVVMSNPAIDPDRGVVYVGSDSHYVYALEAATGDELWSTDVDGHVIGSITATAETILVGSYDTHLYALDRETGNRRWRVENRGHVTSGAIPATAGSTTPSAASSRTTTTMTRRRCSRSLAVRTVWFRTSN